MQDTTGIERVLAHADALIAEIQDVRSELRPEQPVWDLLTNAVDHAAETAYQLNRALRAAKEQA